MDKRGSPDSHQALAVSNKSFAREGILLFCRAVGTVLMLTRLDGKGPEMAANWNA